ncbi:PepSY-associated TM helix domain-containing protein [Methylobacter sp.]|uniref:PepSY-associated TM helix domain-containing protein n=1 Tax=Methylobacter sp. TaxID=2051955 RepID=UPI002FDC9185
MRTEVIRIYKTVHTWAGILTGLVLFIAFYAGAITVFKEPLERWIAPPNHSIRAPLTQMHELITQTLSARPDAGKEFTLHLGDEEHVPARLTWQKKTDGDVFWSTAIAQDGSLQIARIHPSGLARFVDMIHRTGGIPGNSEIGEHFMGVVAMLYGVALISGLIVLLPSLARNFLALRLGTKLKRIWLDAHNLIGVASFPFHLVMALSAVVFAFHDHLYDIQDAVVYAGKLKPIMKADSPFSAVKQDPQPAAMLPPDMLLARVKSLSPAFEPVMMQYRDAGTRGASVRVSGNDPRYMLRGKGFLVMSPVSGEILNTDYFPGRQDLWNAPVSAIFALHFASFGGDTVRWCYFFLGLAGAFLFYSGNRLWIETRSRDGRDKSAVQRRSTRFMAALTVGVCFGCISGISLTIVAGKWLHGHVADVDAWHKGIYYAVFLGSIAWAFLRDSQKAAVELLFLAAATTAAIPLTTLLAWVLPSLGMWVNDSPAAIGVDVVALAGALALLRMMRYRARNNVGNRYPLPVGEGWGEGI